VRSFLRSRSASRNAAGNGSKKDKDVIEWYTKSDVFDEKRLQHIIEYKESSDKSSDKSSDESSDASSFVAVSDKEREEDKRNNISTQISSALDEKFAAFWKAYPKKKGKTDALKAFKKLKPTQDMLDQMLAAIEKQKKSDQWQREHGQYIPYPAKWLKHGQWEDEVEVSIPRDTNTFKDITGKGATHEH